MPTRYEITFTRTWLAHADEHDEIPPHWQHRHGEATVEIFEEAARKRLVEWSELRAVEEPCPNAWCKGDRCGARLCLTPRGADLVATARAVGLPDVADDETPPEPAPSETKIVCPKCKGKRRIPVAQLLSKPRTIVDLVGNEEAAPVPRCASWDVGCDRCGGEGEVPALSEVKFTFTVTDTASEKLARVQDKLTRALEGPRLNPHRCRYVADCRTEKIQESMASYTSYGLRGMYNEPLADYFEAVAETYVGENDRLRMRSLTDYTLRGCATGRTPARKPESEPVNASLEASVEVDAPEDVAQALKEMHDLQFVRVGRLCWADWRHIRGQVHVREAGESSSFRLNVTYISQGYATYLEWQDVRGVCGTYDVTPETEIGVSPDQLPSHLRSSEEL